MTNNFKCSTCQVVYENGITYIPKEFGDCDRYSNDVRVKLKSLYMSYIYSQKKIRKNEGGL